MMLNLQTVLAVVAAVAIVVHFVCVCDRMDAFTSHRIRASYGLIGTSALAVALGPLYGSAPSWADTCAVLSIAMYLIVDRRGRSTGPQDRRF